MERAGTRLSSPSSSFPVDARACLQITLRCESCGRHTLWLVQATRPARVCIASTLAPRSKANRLTNQNKCATLKTAPSLCTLKSGPTALGRPRSTVCSPPRLSVLCALFRLLMPSSASCFPPSTFSPSPCLPVPWSPCRPGCLSLAYPLLMPRYRQEPTITERSTTCLRIFSGVACPYCDKPSITETFTSSDASFLRFCLPHPSG